MSLIVKYILAGACTVGLYVGGVWFGTDVLGLAARPVNAGFYILATVISFTLNYVWVFQSSQSAGSTLIRYLALQAFGILCNVLWVEGGLRLTAFWPWIIAASFFAIWPFLSFLVQRRFVFNR